MSFRTSAFSLPERGVPGFHHLRQAVLQLFVPLPANTNSVNPDIWWWLWFLRAEEMGLLSVTAPSALLPSLPVVFCSQRHISSTAGERRASSAGKAARKQPATFRPQMCTTRTEVQVLGI